MTTCPAEVSEILLEILGWGLVVIRLQGWEGQAARCAVDADHLHNLPSLLADYDRKGYSTTGTWNEFAIWRASPEHLDAFELLWRRLEPHVAAIRRSMRLP